MRCLRQCSLKILSHPAAFPCYMFFPFIPGADCPSKTYFLTVPAADSHAYICIEFYFENLL